MSATTCPICGTTTDMPFHTCNRTPKAERELSPAPCSADRDGNWLDKWGACKVCDGEIPHGHSHNCDILKLELKVKRYETILRRVLEWCETESPNFEIDADAIRAALNPPNNKISDERRK